MEYPFKDLLPLDEVLEREGYYKDWTHLDPKVFYSLTQISEYIKTKGFGVDVRLLIAQLAEHFGLKTTQVVDLANLLQQKFTHLEGVTQSFTNNINSLVAQMEADKNAVIANATVDSEVILARGGKATLGQRLDETTAQLAKGELFKKNSTFLQNVIDKMHHGEEVNIVSIGDSTANSSRADDAFSSPRYHERIQSNLRSFYNRSNINVINKAVGGRPAIAAVRDIEYYDTDPIKPDLWIIMFGINDANPDYAEGQTIEDFKENMSILTERALSKGAEVLLVSPSSIWKPDYDRPRRQKNYARAVKDVASKYQVAYFDLEYNFSKLIIDDVYGIDDLVGSDFVHKTDLGYKLMGDLVSQNLLNTDMYVQEGVTIPVRRSPYLSTNSATITKDTKDKYGHHLILNKAVPNEFLKFNFMVTEPNINLVLIAPLRSTGGVIKYTVDGIEKTLDFYSPTMAYNAEFVVAENIAIGYHEISFNSNDITLGQATSAYDPVVNFSAFQFRKNTNKLDALFNSDDSSFTKYKSVIGAVELSNSESSDKAAVFGEYVHEGDLTFLAKGKFVPNTGIMWNAKDNFSGYLLRFHTNLIIVATVRGDDALGEELSSFDLKQYSGTVDYANEITFKIENKKDGTINVYMNGVLIITLVDTRHRSGRFGIFAKNASLNIGDLKYSIT